MSTRNIVKNIRSKELSGNGPKLPTSGQLDYGEIAVNYKKGYETLSLKNDNNEIVSLSVNTVNDVTVNGTSVVSNKTAGITMKGETIPVADTYEQTVYPSPFEANAQHIVKTDKVSEALKKVETNISKLVSEIIDDEEVSAAAILKLAETAGTINEDGNVEYQKEREAHYIKDAVSVHDATVILDNSISGLATTISSLQATINSLTEIVNQRLAIEWVNFGLTSGTLWAKCNLGAVTETEYGDYFMWGSTTPDTNNVCGWTNAPFNNGSDSYNSTYFSSVKDTVAPNGILAKEYDAAYKATNGMARIPTKDEFQELLDNTTMTWEANFNGSGRKGYKFTSKTDTSKYIFIPASGDRIGSSLVGQNALGHIRSSSLYSETDKVWFLSCYPDGVDANAYDIRSIGMSIRPVKNVS